MTREEAIYTLRGLFIPCASDGNKWGCDRNEALDMAIEALKEKKDGNGIHNNNRDNSGNINGGVVLSDSVQVDTVQTNTISRLDALEQMAQAECGLHYADCEADNCSCSYIQRILDIPSAEAKSPTIPMFAESEDAYREWTGEDIGCKSFTADEWYRNNFKDGEAE